MAVLTISTRKGGSGKTVVTTSLAAAMAAEGRDGLAILDADPNAAAHRWATAVHAGPAVRAYAEADAERLADLLPVLAERHAVLLVDTAGFASQASTVAIAGADAVLVPCTPGEGDVIEAQRTVAYVQGLGRNMRRPLPVRVLGNRIRRSTTLSRHVLAQLDKLGLPRLQTVLSEAVAFGELGFSGALPPIGAAAEDVAALLAELRELGWLPVNVTISEDVKA